MLVNRSIKEIINGYKAKEFSPVEILEQYINQIKIHNPKLNAFITVNEEKAMEQARISEKKVFASDDLGVLEGIPISYKDSIDTKGIVTTSGSQIHKNRIPESNAHVVKMLRNEGAITIGKTNMYEFGFGITAENPFFGDILNPWNEHVTAGGSSGGSAVAVAANLCMGSIGTDTAGSIRVPSSFNGVVGLKPTLELINKSGVSLSNTLDHVGPIARTVEDLAFILEAITRKPYRNNCIPDVRGMRIGVPRQYFNERLDSHVTDLYNKALKTFEALGAVLIDIDIPKMDDPRDVAHAIATSEVGYVHRELITTSLDQYSDEAKKTFEKSKSIPAHTYIEGLNKRAQMTNDISRLFEDIDVILTPTTPIVAPSIGLKEVALAGEIDSLGECLIRFTSVFNITGHPALSIPCGLTPESVPVGLQLIANHHREDILLHTAYAYEQSSLVDFYKTRENILGVAGRSQ